MFEDFDKSWYWYCQAGYRDVVEELTRLKNASLTLPGWDKWVDLQIQTLPLLIKEFQIPQQIVRNPKKVDRWPNPGAMVMYGINPNKPLPSSRQFLQHLNDWYYREMSSQAHLGFRGLSNIGYAVMFNTLSKSERENLEKETFPAFRSIQISRTVILSVVLLSEINCFFKFSLDHRLLELWLILCDSSPDAKEIFELRYKALLPHTLINL